ncbi:MAG TPA: AraC family transcriptional regulator [Candidatus Acidoferrales bacterium]|nr:AraC family transcriptional regulator [Candidatus Acidoferrales bacterium]
MRNEIVAAGDGWRVVDVVCTAGPEDRPFEERHTHPSISLVLAGAFHYKSARGVSLMSTGALLLGNAGDCFECSHRHGEGDRCLSFQFEPALFERLTEDVRTVRSAFARDRLPPLRMLSPLTTRAQMALAGQGSFEEIALEIGAAAVRVASGMTPEMPASCSRDSERIVAALRQLEASSSEAHPLADLAQAAGLSRYHFLRSFRAVTGVTPHQWLLRARLRNAARRLVTTHDPVTRIALDVGFEDLSNFIRSFRAEFGVSPRAYRHGGA